MEVLVELKAAPHQDPDGAVFVRANGHPIVSIREALDQAKNKAGCPTAICHDIRRSTIRRWERMGVHRGAVMQAVGHKPVTIHEKYAELDETNLLEAFQIILQPNSIRAAGNF
jgi:hypothetical protein